MSKYQEVCEGLAGAPKTWLITGVAGFIGSNLLEHLLKLNQTVVGLDNFATGYQRNLDEVRNLVSEEQWARFRFLEGISATWKIALRPVTVWIMCCTRPRWGRCPGR